MTVELEKSMMTGMLTGEKMEKKIIRDFERGEELSLTELRTEYENLKRERDRSRNL